MMIVRVVVMCCYGIKRCSHCSGVIIMLVQSSHCDDDDDDDDVVVAFQ